MRVGDEGVIGLLRLQYLLWEEDLRPRLRVTNSVSLLVQATKGVLEKSSFATSVFKQYGTVCTTVPTQFTACELLDLFSFS